MSSPLIYEVNAQVPKEIYSSYKIWLDAHIEEMLQLPYFSEARVYEAADLSDQQKHLKMHYFLSYPAALEDYLAKQASAMRSRLPEEFRDCVKYSRFTLSSLEKT